MIAQRRDVLLLVTLVAAITLSVLGQTAAPAAGPANSSLAAGAFFDDLVRAGQGE